MECTFYLDFFFMSGCFSVMVGRPCILVAFKYRDIAERCSHEREMKVI